MRLHSLFSVDDADCLGYTKPPPVEEAIAVYLCLTRRHRFPRSYAALLPTTPRKCTCQLVQQTVLLVFQAKMQQVLDQRALDPNSFRKLNHRPATRSNKEDVYRALPVVSEWVLNMITNGYILRFACRPPCFSSILVSEVSNQDALVLRAEIHSFLAKTGDRSFTIFYSPEGRWSLPHFGSDTIE